MSKRQRYVTDVAEDGGHEVMLIGESHSSNEVQVEAARSHRSSRRVLGSGKQIRHNRRAETHLAGKFDDHLSLAQNTDPTGDEMMTDEQIEVGSGQISTSKEQQRSASSAQVPTAQASHASQTPASRDRQAISYNDLSVELFEDLCILGDQLPEASQPVAERAFDTLNELHDRYETDLKQKETKIAARGCRIDTLTSHISELNTYWRNKCFHAEYDVRILRSELQMAKRDLKKSKSGQTERKLREAMHVLDSRLAVANGHLYGEGGPLAKSKS